MLLQAFPYGTSFESWTEERKDSINLEEVGGLNGSKKLTCTKSFVQQLLATMRSQDCPGELGYQQSLSWGDLASEASNDE
eukprot:999248-Amphidinium_carterae.1